MPRNPYTHKIVPFGQQFLKEESSDHFFEEHGSQVTVTKERYIEVLSDFWKELESLYPSLTDKFWFQQDGASSHTSNLSREWLKNHFRKHVVSLKTEFEWAPYSPDLSPPDFFLWGYLKDKLYSNKPRTISELKENIREEIRAIPSKVSLQERHVELLNF